MSKTRLNSGFTIVELLIVIIIIGLLATITVVSYRGVTGQAAQSAVKANLKNAAEEIELQKSKEKVYPAALSNFEKPIAGTDTTTYQYARTNNGFCLMGTSKRDTSIVFSINEQGHFSSEACVMPTVTSASCFSFNASTHFPGRAIVGYFEREDDQANTPECSKDVIIPATIAGVTVLRIAEDAFKGMRIRSVEVPATVQEIHQGAFTNNPWMTTARVSSSTTIETDPPSFESQVVITRY